MFCTAYDAHALKAFEAAAVDYLVKPVRPERLQVAVERARTFTAQGVQLRVQAVRPDGTIAGRVRAFSGPHGFELRPARGRAGLYESTDAGRRLHAGWVVLPDGSLRGAMVSTRKPCRFVLVSGPNGSQQWVSVC